MKTTATKDAVLRAYSRAVKRYAEQDLIASEVSAGFVIVDGQPRGKATGYQVFVKVCAFSQELLKQDPMTGGLLINETKRPK